MSAAAVEHPCDGEPPTLLEEADTLMEQLPGYRVEIIGGILTVTPPPDAPHARALTKIMRPFIAADLDDGQTEVLQGVGVWLPTGAEDFVIPDLAVVDADIDAHVIAHNCYDPVAFRLVLEVTSTNYNQDLRAKVSVYAEADIPVYVIVNRKHQRVHVLTEPVGSDYASHQIFAAGQQAPLPASIGGDVTLDVAAVLQAGSKVRAQD
ncbi:Uma2 family endonuclease [Streptomyces sp. NBC_01089]|uniref:Uma2 family endonuclease n=1 Tax=Streptomyces sp. NBC_01089 TaxID=2903747 RepID=UPI00386E064E|nr:Uma2 family endonuclease [Streptomyces sp. NBC_01089]